MKERKNLCVIVDAYSTANTLAGIFSAYGYQSIHIQSSVRVPTFMLNTFRKQDFIENFIYEGNIDLLCEIIKKLTKKIVCVIAGAECGVELADLLSERLGVYSNGSKYSKARRDKYQMVETLKLANVHTVDHFKSDNLRPILNWIRHKAIFPNPVVLKPIASSSTDGFHICHNEKDVEQAFYRIHNSKNLFGDLNEEVLVQNFLDGQEYAVNMVSFDGKHYISEIWRTNKVTYLHSKIYDLETIVTEEESEFTILKNYTEKVLNALHIEYGPSHTEIIITKDGKPTLVESAARFMGSMDLSLITQAQGINAISLTAEAFLATDLFLKRFTEARPKIKKYPAMVQLIAKKTGILLKNVNVERLAGLETFVGIDIYVQPGSQIKQTVDTRSSPGLVFLCGNTMKDVYQDYLAIRQLESKDEIYPVISFEEGQKKKHKDFNPHWINTLTKTKIKNVILRSGTLDKVQAFINNQNASLVKMLPAPLFFNSTDYEKLCHAAQAILSAQTKIINYLCSSMLKEDVLKMFNAPTSLVPFINWDELCKGEHLVSRFDIVPGNDGYYFCEINSDSSVFGSEIFDCLKIYSENLGFPAIDKDYSPLTNIALLLKKVVDEKGLNKIIICDLSKYKNLGYFTFETMKAYLNKIMPHIPVYIFDETTYAENYFSQEEGKKALVYRVFVFSDMENNAGYFKKVVESGATIINTFESEIRTHRMWFELFHKESYHHLLSVEEITAIRDHIPFTFALNRENLAQAVALKDSYVFKASYSYGGSAVLMGDEVDAEKLRHLIQEKSIDNWVAQKIIRFDGLELPHDSDFKCTLNNLVFGLYVVDNRATGMLVRASNFAKVVNVSSGKAKANWAIPINEENYNKLIERLRAIEVAEVDRSEQFLLSTSSPQSQILPIVGRSEASALIVSTLYSQGFFAPTTDNYNKKMLSAISQEPSQALPQEGIANIRVNISVQQQAGVSSTVNESSSPAPAAHPKLGH